MKIVVGSDRKGYSYKQNIIRRLLDAGHYISDVGIFDESSGMDYPEIVKQAVKGLRIKEFERAILISDTGIEMAIAANKIFGIYAAVCDDIQTIQDSILKNNCNVLCIGSKLAGYITSEKLIEYWLALQFDPNGEYAPFVRKIKEMEKEQTKS